MSEQENPYWSEEVKSNYHPPEGTFTKSAPEVVKILLTGAGNDPLLALHRLVFYMNRAGDKLTNSRALETAKLTLEDLIQKDKQIH